MPLSLSLNAKTPINRRRFIRSSAAAAIAMVGTPHIFAAKLPLQLPADHLATVLERKRRIVVQYDAHDVMLSYWKLHRNGDAKFDRFRDAVFSHVDEPGSQIDAASRHGGRINGPRIGMRRTSVLIRRHASRSSA
jgi:hypothetical protein